MTKKINNSKGHIIKLKKKHISSMLGQYNSFEEAVSDAKYTSQLEAYLYLLNGDNVFLCGPAGSGKSYVVQNYCNIMKEMNPDIQIEKTSTTGLSAINIGGKTIHSFANLGISKETYEETYERMTAPYHEIVLNILKEDKRKTYNSVMKNFSKEFNYYQYNLDKIKKTDILIIDEISMLSERSFDTLHKKILASGNENIQIIVSGDFSQLPPVARNEDVIKHGNEIKNFCFESPAWNERKFRSCYLDKLYRAKEKSFGQFLDAISSGKGDNPKVINFINNKLKKSSTPFMDGVAYLTTKNINVEKINEQQQQKNKNKAYSNTTIYPLNHLIENSKKFAKELNVKEVLTLKPGDTVMITDNLKKDTEYYCSHNIAPELKNGTIGTFFITENEGWGIKVKNEKNNSYYYYHLKKKSYEKIEKSYNKELKRSYESVKASFVQYPLKLAYAITIHKSQGQTFSNIVCDLTDCFSPGLGYVALSRATNFEGITLYQNPLTKDIINHFSLKMNDESLEIKKKIKSLARKNRKKHSENHKDFWNLITKDKKKN